MYDLIIIGGGPAGITAAATALNQRLRTSMIAERRGGQTTYAMQLADVEGREVITGEKLLDAFRRQLDYLDFVRRFDTVIRVKHKGRHVVVSTAQGDCFEGHTLIIATGAKPQRLNIPGEARLSGHGLSYSATTHASLFLGKDVAVVGKERRAQWATADLARKAHLVYLLAPESFNLGLVREWVDCNRDGYIIVDVNCATNRPGVFVAGDVTHVSEQVLVHTGEGAKAAISAYHYLLMHRR